MTNCNEIITKAITMMDIKAAKQVIQKFCTDNIQAVLQCNIIKKKYKLHRRIITE